MAKMQSFKLISGGAAYNLDIGFTATKVEVYNQTKWATDGATVHSVYNAGMPAGYALVEKCEDTSSDKALVTSNGFTPYSTSAVNSNQKSISGITQANPAVVTVGSTAAWASAQSVRISGVVGMTEINNLNKPFEIEILSSTTFALKGIDSTAFGAYSSGGTALNMSVDTTASGFTGITLGTSVVGADGDVLEVHAYGADNFQDLGDIGA